jgi:hypothetical protein
MIFFLILGKVCHEFHELSRIELVENSSNSWQNHINKEISDNLFNPLSPCAIKKSFLIFQSVALITYRKVYLNPKNPRIVWFCP